MSAIYNEIDTFAASWLEELMRADEVMDGRVERRGITELCGDDVRGYDRCHFFAGIGGWDYALKLAGWPADAPVWTGSCPCQPFSAAGKGLGERDPRHLWPEFLRLIALCRPPVVFGEQVASKAGRLWLAGVRADLEALGYAVGASDLCAAGVGAPHIRQRLYWVAYAPSGQEHDAAARGLHAESCERVAASRMAYRDGWRCGVGQKQHGEAKQDAADWHLRWGHVGGCGDTCGMADADHGRREQRDSGERGVQVAVTGIGMDYSNRARSQGWRMQPGNEPSQRTAWSSSSHVVCTDGKARRVEPGVCPLAHGVSGRVGQLRGYGNAIVPQVAATFVRAFMETINDTEVA